MQPLVWLCNTNDIRIQDGETNTIRISLDGLPCYSNETTYHVWNNIRGTIARDDIVGCFATAYDTKQTGQSLEMGTDVDILQQSWLQIKCPTYEDKWYYVCGSSKTCPIGANGTNTIKGSINSGNFNTDINNRAIIVVRVVGKYDINKVPPGIKAFKLVVGGSY